MSLKQATVYPAIRMGNRNKRSPVWEYFTYDISTRKSICQVTIETRRSRMSNSASPGTCDHRIRG